ncbi:MAG: T9SS type A sorting domain-containing protein, partial [Saprospiraceae bacterium]|nr:T9SS type A sorting domain-containing protein [Saprospiraceae bacterium]
GESVCFNGWCYDIPGAFSDTIYSTTDGCDTVVTIVISEQPPVEIIAETILPDDGTGSGAIHLFADPTFIAYQWNSGHVGPSATGLSAGTYIVTVTSQAGCEAVDTFTVPSLIPIDPAFDPRDVPTVFPNPMSGGNSNLMIPGDLQVDECLVLDLNGREISRQAVWPGSTGKLSLEVPSGTYLVVLLHKDTPVTTLRLVSTDADRH